MPSHRYMISGGGTGGHIFPAIAIAHALRKREADAEFLFVGAKGRMEMEKVPVAGFKIEGLWISGLQRRLTFKNALFPVKVISSLLKARKLINQFKPHVVIGVGGYASGPLLQVAASRGIPTLIQEQNSFPGITNRLLGKKVNRICVAYEGMERWFPKAKIVITGNPVRQEVTQINGKKNIALGHFGLQENQKTLLVIGGSLGARTINEGIAAGLKKLTDAGIQVIWQTGKHYEQSAKEWVEQSQLKGVAVQAFISKMDLAYAAADIVVSRAGAISISELSAVRKPAILVPSPNVAEDHQTKNAMALVNNNAALLVTDVEAPVKLVGEVMDTINNEQLLEELTTNIGKMAFENAADAIAAQVIDLIAGK